MPESDSANAELWRHMTAKIRPRLSPSDYALWIERIRLHSFERRTITLLAPHHLLPGLHQRYRPLLQYAAQESVGADIAILLSALDNSGNIDIYPPQPQQQTALTDKVEPELSHTLHPKYTFDQFVIGATNRFAHAAALAAAEHPGGVFNPLLIVGPPGVGKTHLLHSVGHYITDFGGGLTVRYATAEEFATSFRIALREKTIDGFKRYYRRADVLLLDDVQFLAGKKHTEEEFFHTFNTLIEVGSQIIMTADCMPRSMSGLAERLRQRFDSGLVTEIDQPDGPTRHVLLRKRAALDGIELSDEVAAMLSERVDGSVRDLESALIRVSAYASLNGLAVDTELAATVLDRLYKQVQAATPLSIDTIQAAVADTFGLTRKELVSKSQAKRVVRPRQLGALIARERTDESLTAIGKAFGYEDHTSVKPACRRAKQLLEEDDSFAEQAKLVEETLRFEP